VRSRKAHWHLTHCRPPCRSSSRLHFKQFLRQSFQLFTSLFVGAPLLLHSGVQDGHRLPCLVPKVLFFGSIHR